MRVELNRLTGNADLQILNADGNAAEDCDPRFSFSSTCRSSRPGTSAERLLGELEAGTYYIWIEAKAGSEDIDYELRYSDDSSIPGRTRVSAFDLGNLSEVDADVRGGRVDAERNETNLVSEAYFKFRLDGTRKMEFELRDLTGNADLQLLDFDGNRIDSSRASGTSDERIERELQQGIYFIRVDAQEGSRDISYRLHYGIRVGS